VGLLPGKHPFNQSGTNRRNSNLIRSNLLAIDEPPLLHGGQSSEAIDMNHSLYSADRQTHRRIVGSAFVAILIITTLSTAIMSKFEQQSVLSSSCRA
jgi:hypothetical protein